MVLMITAGLISPNFGRLSVRSNDLPPYVIIEETDLAFTAGSVSGSTSESSDPVVLSINRTNDLLVGIIFFLGLIFGGLGMSIFWNRFKGD